MHHSGTALMAQLLSEVGICFDAANPNDGRLVEQQATASSVMNPGDYFREVNTQLLQLAGCESTGFDAPQKLLWAARQCEKIVMDDFRHRELANLVGTLSAGGCWGWEDPRTVLTWDLWQRVFNELKNIQLRPVIVVRQPAEVVSEMADRARIAGERQLSAQQLHRMATDLWLTYNRWLWKYCLRNRWTVVTYRAIAHPNSVADELTRAVTEIGFDPARVASALPRLARLVQSVLASPSLGKGATPPEANELYEQFKRLAAPSRKHLTESAMDRDESKLLLKASGLKEAGRIDAAVELLEQSLKIRPQYRASRFLLSYTLMETGHIERSEQHARWLIDTQPDDPVGHGLRAFGLTQQARIDEALVAFRACIERQPDNSVAWSNLLFASLYSDTMSPPEVTALHIEGSAAIAKTLKAKQTSEALPVIGNTEHRTTRRLRIGYLSADLRKHPVGYFLRWLLEYHDSKRLDVFCYNTSSTQDDLTKILRQDCPNWQDVSSLDDWQLTKRIRSDRIDLLIDLSGHSSGNRCGVIIRRAAPVQASYLGYPATSGLSEMDFIIADHHLCPPEYDHLYTERVARLERCFLCFYPHDDAPLVAPALCEKNGFVTFGSFNNLPKISPSTISLWSQLLKRVPDSRLVIKALSLIDSGTRRLFHQHFADQGIDCSRVDLLPPTVPLAEYLDEYRRIDIGLDPIPYNGGTTTCEALWMGVPVITLPRLSFCGRMGHSILSTLGYDQWIAQSQDEYVSIAAQLAAQPQLIAEHRRTIRLRMLDSPLCDGRQFTLDFENLCRRMVDQVAS